MTSTQMPQSLGSPLEQQREELLLLISQNMDKELSKAIDDVSEFRFEMEEAPEFVIQTEGACHADQE